MKVNVGVPKKTRILDTKGKTGRVCVVLGLRDHSNTHRNHNGCLRGSGPCDVNTSNNC